MLMNYVVVNDAEHSGSIVVMEEDDIWTSENPTGWTEQDLCGPHGRIAHNCSDAGHAQALLREYLQCDSVATGTYCYSHNPHPRD